MRRQLGESGIHVNAIGYGEWPLSNVNRPTRDQAFAVIRAALEAGADLIDTSDAYCLDDGEFDFTSTPSLGGPEEPIATADLMQVSRIVTALDTLSVQLQDRQRQPLAEEARQHEDVHLGQLLVDIMAESAPLNPEFVGQQPGPGGRLEAQFRGPLQS